MGATMRRMGKKQRSRTAGGERSGGGALAGVWEGAGPPSPPWGLALAAGFGGRRGRSGDACAAAGRNGFYGFWGAGGALSMLARRRV